MMQSLWHTCDNFHASRAADPGNTSPRLIPLTRGKFAVVDAEDYEKLSKYKWFAEEKGRSWYARRNDGNRQINMHREIMNAPAELVVDHIDHDGLNNRRSNLRLATMMQNVHNQRRAANNTSQYKGVHFHKGHKRWSAYITANRKRHSLGYFEDEIEAAKAYDDAAKRLHGEFASLNLED